MIQKLATSNAARAVLYALLATPFLLVVNYVSPHALRDELASMPPIIQALVILNGVMSLYILAARRTTLNLFRR